LTGRVSAENGFDAILMISTICCFFRSR